MSNLKSLLAALALAIPAASISSTSAKAEEVQCVAVAVAFFGEGPPLPGTRGIAERYSLAEACDAAIDRCERKLEHKRYQDDFPYPAARCRVVNRNVSFY